MRVVYSINRVTNFLLLKNLYNKTILNNTKLLTVFRVNCVSTAVGTRRYFYFGVNSWKSDSALFKKILTAHLPDL